METSPLGIVFGYFMKNYTWKTLGYYWQHMRGYSFSGWAIVFSSVVAWSLNTAVPWFYKKFFDILSQNGDRGALYQELIKILLIVISLELLAWFFWRIMGFTVAYFESRVLADLSNTCFAYIHKHSFTFFNNSFVGSLVKKVHRFTRSFESLIDRAVFNILPLLVQSSIILSVIFYINFYLGLGLLIWLIIFLTFNWLFVKYKLPYDIKRSEADSKTGAILADTFTNQVNVKLFNGYCRELFGFGEAVKKLRDLRFFTWNLMNIFEAVQGFLAIILEVGLLFYGTVLWKQGLFGIGDFVLVQSYVISLFGRIWDFGRVMQHAYEDLADAVEMTEVLETVHEIKDIPQAKVLKVKGGQINFKKVCFNYNQTRSILKDFDLQIKSGERVALVGPSGAGKSTIIKLVLRLHEVFAGEILIDGQDVKKVTQESLWQNISLVPQDPILFHRSLLENIRYGRPEASDEEVYAAAKKAHCHEFIIDLPEKYQTFVGERGVKLSGGERQRVAIARAILRNAPILILDEATSSLDSESEHYIQDALDILMKNKTVIVIAHRLSTIMKTNRILVIDHGGIVEEGTHNSLLKKKNGLYKKLWNIQAGGFIE